MSILSQAQKLQLQTVLQLRRAALDSQRSAHLEGQSRAEHARELLLQDSDDAEQRDAERELDFALTDRDAVELREIDQALARLAEGHYGLCADCGAEIPAERLQLSPQALRCVACGSRLERGPSRVAALK
jgi:DnaK suppressor protein